MNEDYGTAAAILDQRVSHKNAPPRGMRGENSPWRATTREQPEPPGGRGATAASCVVLTGWRKMGFGVLVTSFIHSGQEKITHYKLAHVALTTRM